MRYFIAVAEELNFTRAAGRLNMAQPPLSQQIRRLEQELGVTLFFRTKRRVALTDAGRVFLEQAYQITRSVEHAAVLVQRVERGESGRLVVGFLEYMSYTLLPPIMRMFRERFPGVEVVLRPLSNVQQVSALRYGNVDVSLLRPPIDDPEISSELILREPFIVAIPASHPRAGRRTVSINGFANDAFIMYQRDVGPSFFNAIYNFCAQAGFTPKVALEVSHIHAAVGLVGAGIGVALVPRSVRKVTLDNVVYKSLTDKAPTVDVMLAWQRQTSSPLINAFVETCKQSAMTLS